MQVSIIIPVLNEISILKTMSPQFAQFTDGGVEMIFVDGGSTDGSFEYLKSRYENVLSCPSGRAKQMNFGANKAKGNSLIFLHVDTVFEQLNLSLDEMETNFDWGFFKLKLSGRHWLFRLIERGIRFRSLIFRVATGDQVLVFKKSFFKKIGGFPDLELMEDVAITRLARSNSSPHYFRSYVISSSRRWEQHGPIKTCFFMWYIQLLYRLGVKTNTLNRLYRQGSWL